MKFISFAILFFIICNKQIIASIETEILKDLFSKNDLETKPEYATAVNVSIYVINIRELDDEKHTFSVQMFFRQKWTDERLQFKNNNPLRIFHDKRYKIWLPDTYFDNSISESEPKRMNSNSLIRISPNGNILFSQSINSQLSCAMDLQYFPFDKQQCSIEISSYGYSTKDLVLNWESRNPVSVSPTISIPLFLIKGFEPHKSVINLTSGNYSRLLVSFTFERVFGSYILQVYIPCAMLIIISWMVFWIDTNAFLSRILISITTLLTMAMMVQKMHDNFPKCSYIKAIDVWTGVCLTFTFYTLIECIFFQFINRNAESNSQVETYEAINQRKENGKNLESNLKRWTKKIDLISLIGYPLLFMIFNIIYWARFLN